MNLFLLLCHGLRTPGEEIDFTARPKINSQSQIFRYGRSIFCLPQWPKFSDFFDVCLHWVSVVRARVDYITIYGMFLGSPHKSKSRRPCRYYNFCAARSKSEILTAFSRGSPPPVHNEQDCHNTLCSFVDIFY